MFSVRKLFDISFRMRLRRFPLIHKPLQWANRKFLPFSKKLLFAILRIIVPRKTWLGPPRGWFSEIDFIRSGAIEGGIVVQSQGMVELPNPSIILLCGREQHLEQPWPIFWTHHKNSRLIGPGLVHTNERKEVSLEAAYGLKRAFTDPGWFYFASKSPVFLSGSWTSLISTWVPNNKAAPFAHWLLEALPRLALLERFPADTGVLIPPQELPYQVESLKLMGLWDRCRKTPEQHLLVEDYYFSSQPSMIVCYSPYAVSFLRATFLPKLPKFSTSPKRLFIRRTSFGRNMANEEEVLAFFSANGWTVVDAASLSFIDQIRYFAGAEAVWAIHGSGTANMAWCSPGCKFVEMFADCYLAGDQEWISRCVQVDYHFMIFPSDYKLDAVIDLEKVKSKMKDLNLF